MELNINLIPDSRKEQIIRSRHLKLIIKTEIGISFLIVILFAFILFINNALDISLNAQTVSQELENSQGKYKEIHDYENDFKDINNNIKEVRRVKEDQLYWTELLLKLSSNMTPGIEMTDLATNRYSVILVGKAENRDSLLVFKDKLSQEECFNEVNLPLSDLVSQENISFEMDFKMEENCLKKR